MHTATLSETFAKERNLAASPELCVEPFREVRAWTEALCRPLVTEDFVAQSMPDASPVKWHLAHTTWFFETFLLLQQEGYKAPDPRYAVLFNSYYNSLGKPFHRPDRGLITRPTVAEVREYRAKVDRAVVELLASASSKDLQGILPLLEVGLNHEQQHQELIVTDLKHLFSRSPLLPVYRTSEPEVSAPPELRWHDFGEDLYEIGHGTPTHFAFDNEGPRHRIFVEDFGIASRPVTNGEFLDFIRDGGYLKPELWLSDGWAAVETEGWRAPLYWWQDDEQWLHYTLAGPRPVGEAEPVCHLSLYEADAFARWAGARLPSEAEWEIAAEAVLGDRGAGFASDPEANLAESERFHPAPLAEAGKGQFLGDVWEWTRSAYSPYPGYRAPQGALGEYNAKFMSSQMVLRGGSCATPRSHIRTTYRNFFPPHARWQFSGLRLAKDGGER